MDFSIGIDLRSDIWEQRMHEDAHLLELLGPIIQLAADEGVFENPDGETLAPLSETEYDAQLASLPNAVVEVQQYWREYPPGHPPSSDLRKQKKNRRFAPTRKSLAALTGCMTHCLSLNRYTHSIPTMNLLLTSF
jgi:hypothetical protein